MYIKGLPYYVMLTQCLEGLNKINYTSYEFEVEQETSDISNSVKSILKFYSVEHKEGRNLIHTFSIVVSKGEEDHVYYYALSWILRHGLNHYKLNPGGKS